MPCECHRALTATPSTSRWFPSLVLKKTVSPELMPVGASVVCVVEVVVVPRRDVEDIEPVAVFVEVVVAGVLVSADVVVVSVEVVVSLAVMVLVMLLMVVELGLAIVVVNGKIFFLQTGLMSDRALPGSKAFQCRS